MKQYIEQEKKLRQDISNKLKTTTSSSRKEELLVRKYTSKKKNLIQKLLNL